MTITTTFGPTILRRRQAGETFATIATDLGINVNTCRSAMLNYCHATGTPTPGGALTRPRTALRNDAAQALRGFGIEIECRRPADWPYMSTDAAQERIAAALRNAGVNARSERYNHNVSRAWKVIYDCSSDIEVVSPILRGEAGMAEVKTVMRALRAIGCTVSTSEGMHVHVDVRDLDGAARERLVRWYDAAQAGLFDSLVAASRRGTARWCPAFTGSDVEIAAQVANGSRRIGGRDSFRYHALNVCPMGTQGSVEFRQHQGSLNGRKATAWVELLTAVVDAAKADALPTGTDLGVVGELLSAGRLSNRTAAYLLARADALR